MSVMHVCMYVCISVYTYVSMHSFTYAHAAIYTCIYFCFTVIKILLDAGCSQSVVSRYTELLQTQDFRRLVAERLVVAGYRSGLNKL